MVFFDLYLKQKPWNLLWYKASLKFHLFATGCKRVNSVNSFGTHSQSSLGTIPWAEETLEISFKQRITPCEISKWSFWKQVSDRPWIFCKHWSFFLAIHGMHVICEDLNYMINVKTNKTKNFFYCEDLGVKNVGCLIYLYKNWIL